MHRSPIRSRSFTTTEIQNELTSYDTVLNTTSNLTQDIHTHNLIHVEDKFRSNSKSIKLNPFWNV